jgi:hypothetical protein
MGSRLFVLVAAMLVVVVMVSVYGMVFPLKYSGYVWRRVSGNIGSLSYPAVFVDSGKPYIVGVNGSNLVLFDVENLNVRVLTVCSSPVTVVAANGGAYAICSTYLFAVDKNGYVSVKNYDTIPSFAVFNHYMNELAVFIRQTGSTVVDVVGRGSYTLSNIHVYSAGFVNGYWYLLYKNLANNFFYIGKYDSSFNLVTSTSLDYTPYASVSMLPDTFAVNERVIVVVGEIESGYTNIYLHNLTLESYNVEMVGGSVNVVAATANYHIILVNTTGIYRGMMIVWYVNDVGDLFTGPADIRYLLSLGSTGMEYVLRLGLIDSYMYLNDYITGLHSDTDTREGNWYLTLYGVTLATTTTSITTSTTTSTTTTTVTSTIATTDTVTSTVTAALPVYYTRTVTTTVTTAAALTPVSNVAVVIVLIAVVLLLLALYYIFRRVR